MSKLIETKSLLAKLMATENLHIEQRKVATASFDLDNRVLTVPILADDIDADTYDLFMGHEVGHALYTDFESWKKAVEDGENMSILNVVEDFRIEKKIKYKYPGLKNAFIRAYNGLFNRNFFKTKGQNLDEYNFIDRINLHTKVGASLNITFSEEERKLLDEMDSMQSFQDAVEMQRKIVEFMKEQFKEQKQDTVILVQSPEGSIDGEMDEMAELMPMEMDSGDSNESDESDKDGKSSDSDDMGEKGENSESKESDESNQNTTSASESSSMDGSPVEESKNQSGGGKNDPDIQSHTDDAFKESEHMLFDSNRAESTYLNTPSLDLNRVIVDYKDLYDLYKNSFSYYHQHHGQYDNKGFIELRNSLNKTVSYLVKEFELRKNAEQMKKASTAKTGDLNLNKIYSYQFNEDIFKKLTVMNQGKSHGLVMFIDWSGSMQEHLFNTIKQLFNLVMFCKKVNIPYEVYAFSDSHGIDELNSNWIQTAKKNDIVSNPNFKLLNILSSRMNNAKFTEAASALTYIAKNMYHDHKVFSLGSTPLNDTIIAAMDIVPQFQKKNNLQIVNTVFLTDGESNYGLRQFDNSLFTRDVPRWDVYSGSYKRRDIVVRDPVSRHEVRIQSENGEQFTSALIQLLKYRTRSNIIGFYVLSPHEARGKIYRYFTSQYDDLYSQFKKTNHLVVTNQGFDEYYLLKSEKKQEDSSFDTNVKSTKAIANAFAKYANNKMNGRTVLNRFIGLIS